MTTCLSAVPLPEGCVVVFDLDDTLYAERDFVASGFRAVAQLIEHETGDGVFLRLCELFSEGHSDPFAAIISEFRLPAWKPRFIQTYREHRPRLTLAAEVRQLLTDLAAAGHPIALMTDGRSRTQRNKITALGIDHFADAILVSEEFGSSKPDERNYRFLERTFPGWPCAYVGNDPTKDFIAANRLGWQTICVLDQGHQLRPQRFDAVAAAALPQYIIERLA